LVLADGNYTGFAAHEVGRDAMPRKARKRRKLWKRKRERQADAGWSRIYWAISAVQLSSLTIVILYQPTRGRQWRIGVPG